MNNFIFQYLLPVLALTSVFIIIIGIKAFRVVRAQSKHIDDEAMHFDLIKMSMTNVEMDFKKFLFDRKSVYGDRLSHFLIEKDLIAKESIKILKEYIVKNENTQYCLIIDSGTSMFPLFSEIVNHLNRDDLFYNNRNRLCIVSNNIPGILYLMRYGRKNLDDDYSEIQIECFSVPGKPLSVYAAITGNEACKWLSQIRNILDISEWKRDNFNLKIVGLLTGNYICASTVNKLPFSPAARGEGHLSFKKVIADVSDEIFLLAPLMKYSFANVDLLNKICNYDIESKNKQTADIDPRRVKYREVIIPENKKCTIITTERKSTNLFYEFGELLKKEINIFRDKNPGLIDFYSIEHDPRKNSNDELWNKPELEIELPHENLRHAYKKGKNIWDPEWVKNTSFEDILPNRPD